MSRRVILILSLLGLALLALAVAPWSLSTGGLAGAVARHAEETYGLTFAAKGRSTIALLPVPRVKFQDVTIRSADGSVVAEGGTLQGEFRFLPLLLGRAELSEVSLEGSRVVLAENLPALLAGLRPAASPGASGAAPTLAAPAVRRLRLHDATLAIGDSFTAESVALDVAWPDSESPIEMSGRFRWRGEQVDVVQASLDPVALAAGRRTAFAATVAAPSASLTIAGDLEPGADWRLSGRGAITWRSVRDFSRWSDLEVPLGVLMQEASVEGRFTADRRQVSWPSVAVTLGSDRLEGTLGVKLDGERPAVTGTLAAEAIDLSEFVMPFRRARTASGLWSGDELSLAPTTGADLDLRLSATSARIGRLKLAEMAGNVLVRAGRIEASLSRATLNQGNVKGRVGLTAAPTGGMDFKAQASFDGIDLAGFLSDMRQPRWITGQAQGSFVFEGTGMSPVDVIRQSHGRSTVAVKKGELLGIGLADTLHRLEKRPLSAFLDWKGGRTSFEQAQLNLNIGAGLGEIVDGSVLAPELRAALRGRVSLVDRALAIRAQVDATAPNSDSAIGFDVVGGWDDVAVIPDVRSLIERSGAAKPLFDREGPPAFGVRGATAAPAD